MSHSLSLHMSKNVFAMFCVMFGDTVLSLCCAYIWKNLACGLLCCCCCCCSMCVLFAIRLLLSFNASITAFYIHFYSVLLLLLYLYVLLVLASFLIPYLQLGLFLCPYNDCVVHALLFLFMRVHISVILCDYIFHYIRAFFPFTCCICIFCS